MANEEFSYEDAIAPAASPAPEPTPAAAVSPPPQLQTATAASPLPKSGRAPSAPLDLLGAFAQASRETGVPFDLLIAQAGQESGFDPKAVSKTGARGVMQILPSTASQPGYGLAPIDHEDLWDPRKNILFGARYLAARAKANVGGDVDWSNPKHVWSALRSYNGPVSSGGDPNYVESVLRRRGDGSQATPQPTREYSYEDATREKRPVAQDMAHGAGLGMVEGAGMVLGLPSDVWHMLDRGYQWALTAGAEKLGLLSPEEAERLRTPMGDMETSPMGSHAINQHLLRLAGKLGADTSPPDTVPGEYARTIGSFLPSSVLGAENAAGIPNAALRYAAIPGMTSETAGQLTKGTELEPYARVAGAVLPAVPGIAASAVERVTNPMGNALAGATPAQMARAQELIDQARSAGMPLTAAEAIQSVTNGATNLGNVQRVVEQSPQGGAILRPFYAERPAQTQRLGNAMLDEIGAPAQAPAETVARVRGAAEGVVQRERDATNALSRPAYEATANNPAALVPPQAMAIVDQHPALQQALAAVRHDPVRYGDLRGLPDNSMPVLDAAKKYLGDVAETAKRSGENFAASNATRAADDLTGVMDSAFPRYASARNIQSIRQRYVEEPLARSPTGQLAAAETYPQQAGILFSPNPLPGSHVAINKAVRDVAARDPAAAQDLVRMYVERTFNEATQNLASGANQFGGAKFAAVLSGNVQQARNLEAAMMALPDGATRWRAFRRGLDIMEASGARHPVGSQTSFNNQMNEYLKMGHPVGEVMATAASPKKWMSIAHDIFERYSYGRNVDELARAFVSGDVKDLQRIVQARGGQIGQQAAMIGALIRNGSTQPAAQPQSSP